MMQMCQKIILIIYLSNGCVPLSCASSGFDISLCAWQCILFVSAHILRAFRLNFVTGGDAHGHITAFFKYKKNTKLDTVLQW